MKYKTELHCHTSEFSLCSNVSGAETVEKYLENGYSTVVVTNHFDGNYPDSSDYENFTKRYYRAVETMREAAAGRMNVIAGMELTFRECINDYLLYGMTEELTLSIPQIFDMGLRGFREWAVEHGVLVIQAHPTRFRMVVREPWLMDGMEVYNASHDQFSNVTAEAYADACEKQMQDKPYFIRTSGSDHHQHYQKAIGGIATDFEIKDMAQLIEVLKSGNYELLRD